MTLLSCVLARFIEIWCQILFIGDVYEKRIVKQGLQTKLYA